MKNVLDKNLLEANALILARASAELVGNPESSPKLLEQAVRAVLLPLLRHQRDTAADANKAVDAARTVVGLNPDDSGDAGLLANYLARASRLEESLLWANRAIELTANDKQLFRLRACVLESMGRYGEAERDIAKAVQIAAGDPAILEDQKRIAAGYMQRLKDVRDFATDFSEEIAAAEEIIQRRPQEIGEYWSLAETLASAGKWEDVLRCIDRAVALNPGIAKFFHLRATVLERLGLYRESEQAIERAIELSPDDPVLQAARERIAGGLNEQLREKVRESTDLSRTIEIAEELVRRCPTSVADILTLAHLLAEAGRLDQSLRWIDRAIELSPQVSDFYCLRAAVLLRMGRNSEAQEDVGRGQGICADVLTAYPQGSSVLKNVSRILPKSIRS